MTTLPGYDATRLDEPAATGYDITFVGDCYFIDAPNGDTLHADDLDQVLAKIRDHRTRNPQLVLYIAGPMTGLPEFNYPAFNQAERLLRRAGYTVLNPARRGVRDDWTWRDYMRHAVRDVSRADGIALLAGWEASRGARLEFSLATGLDLPAHGVGTWLADAIEARRGPSRQEAHR